MENVSVTTEARTKEDLLNYVFINAWNYCNEGVEAYEKMLLAGSRPPINIMASRIRSLYRLSRRLFENKDALIEDHVNSREYKDLMLAFEKITDVLYNKNILKIDYKKVVDTLRIENANKQKGY